MFYIQFMQFLKNNIKSFVVQFQSSYQLQLNSLNSNQQLLSYSELRYLLLWLFGRAWSLATDIIISDLGLILPSDSDQTRPLPGICSTLPLALWRAVAYLSWS